jgi:uncharacterized membrane protein YebE (DUF533 family)
MDEAKLLEGVLRGVLGGGRRKRGRRTMRYLTGPSLPGLGRMGGSLLSNPTVLMTAAGLAWGLIETVTSQSQPGAAAPQPAAGQPSGSPPPLPVMGTGAHAQSDALRMVRLAISAAQADGGMGEPERAEIERVAAAEGMSGVVAAELTRPTPLTGIVAGVTDAGQRATLYGLAFALVRADEQVNGAERIYLAQLAHLLGLDPAAVSKIEAAASAQIDRAPEEGSGHSPEPKPRA